MSAFPGVAQVVPAGTELQIRLRQTLSSFGTPRGEPVVAEVIAPVESGGVIVIPLGSELVGSVVDVRRVGMGFVRETARIQIGFDRVLLPGGQQLAVTGQINRVDNSREEVDAEGKIHGIRATASLSSMLSGAAVSATAFDPMLLAFGLSSSLSTFRIPESEIVFPPGTEMHFRLDADLATIATFPSSIPPVAATSAARQELMDDVRKLPFRTATQTTGEPSDITNLVFLGSAEALQRAFDAAGWAETDALTARSTYAVMRSVVENQGYREAPMSTLLLDGMPARFQYAKTLDTFFQRHHLRIFATAIELDGVPVWTASSTHDTGIGYATAQKTFIHIIDQNIDRERDKIVNDLLLTGCVTAEELVDRPWAPRDAFNATGDALITDGRAAVVRLNDCEMPHRADAPIDPGSEPSDRPGAPRRVARNTFLTARNDLVRGNIFYQAYAGVKLGLNSYGKKDEPAPTGRDVSVGGQRFQIVSGAEAREHPLGPKDPTLARPTFQPLPGQAPGRETFLEFSISGGYLRFGNDRFSTQALDLLAPLEDGTVVRVPVLAQTELRPGWNLTFNVTLNPWRYFSNEIGFTSNQTVLRATIANPVTASSLVNGDATIRQFYWDLLVHLRPNGSRIRPFLAAGPALQLIRLTDGVETRRTLFRVAFREFGAIYSAWRFADDPPLEGGGIFQIGFHYGGGVKYHVNRRFMLRLDYRETLSAQPDFWTKSYSSLRSFDPGEEARIEPGELEKHGPLRQQRLSLGVGVTF